MKPEEAAIEAASGPSWPLMGATVVAVMAFYPIYSAVGDTGEYAGALFTVVGISLVLSWVLAMTVTPVQCVDLLGKVEPAADDGGDGGALYERFRSLLRRALRY